MATEPNGAGPRRVGLVVRPDAPTGYPVALVATDLVARGWDVRVLSDTVRQLEESDLPGVPDDLRRTRVHPLHTGYRTRGRRIEQARRRARTIGRRPAASWWTVRPGGPPLRLELGPQLLHLPSCDAAPGWLDVAAATGARTVVSVTVADAGAAPLDFPGAPWTRADAIHVESEALAEIVRRLGAPAAAVSVIPAAVDERLLEVEPDSSRGESLRILSVAPLSWTQGYEHALEAIRRLIAQGVPCEYRIVGSGAHADAVAFARHQLGLHDRVELAAPDREQTPGHYGWADVLLDASVLAPSPKARLDAHAAGVPVITTDPDGVDPAAALAVPRRDPEAICAALATLAGDEQLRTRLAEAGRESAREAPTARDEAAAFADLYARLLAGAAPAQGRPMRTTSTPS